MHPVEICTHPAGTCTHASFRSGVCPELLSSNNHNTKNGCLSVRAEWLDTIWCYTKLQTLTFEMAQQGPFDSREGKHCVTIIIPWASRVYEICTLRAVLCILPPGYKSIHPQKPDLLVPWCILSLWHQMQSTAMTRTQRLPQLPIYLSQLPLEAATALTRVAMTAVYPRVHGCTLAA